MVFSAIVRIGCNLGSSGFDFLEDNALEVSDDSDTSADTAPLDYDIDGDTSD